MELETAKRSTSGSTFDANDEAASAIKAEPNQEQQQQHLITFKPMVQLQRIQHPEKEEEEDDPDPVPPQDGLCQVCQFIPFQFHHFGAFVCNRCRAFFRRIVRRSRSNKNLVVNRCLKTNEAYRSGTKSVQNLLCAF